jgi:hypothetical protein
MSSVESARRYMPSWFAADAGGPDGGGSRSCNSSSMNAPVPRGSSRYAAVSSISPSSPSWSPGWRVGPRSNIGWKPSTSV